MIHPTARRWLSLLFRHKKFLLALPLVVLGIPDAGAKPFTIVLPYLVAPPVPDSIIDLADAMGFYKKAGVEVAFKRVIQTPSAIAALHAGDGDMANVASGTVLQLVAQNQMKLRAVVSADKALPFVIAAKKPIASLKELVGKTFGVASVGSTDYIVSRIVLRNLGVPPDALQFVALGTPPVRAQALLAGRIDATAFSIGIWIGLADKSTLSILVDQDAYYDAAPFVTQLDVVTEETAKTKAKEVQAVVRAIIMASRAVAKDPELWVDAMLAARNDLKRDTLEAVAKTYQKSWSVNGGLDLQSIGFTTDTLYDDPGMKGLRRVPPKEWIDTHFVDKVLAENGAVPGADPTGR
jgi:NitT/TauT family transport system substrate-binding protein